MVQPSKPCVRQDPTGNRRASSAGRCLLRKAKMRAVFVVVADVLREHPFQMAFIECDDVVQQVPAAASHPALGEAILPGAFEGSANRMDAQGANSERAIDLPEGTAVQVAVSALGNGSMVTAQDTVPFAVWSAACHLRDYEEALWETVSGLGDRDTTCAMVGGIVVMYAGAESLPKEWLHCRAPIPRHMLKNYQMLSFPDHF